MKRLEIGPPELGVLAGMLRKVEFFSPLTVGQLDKVLPAVMLHAYDSGETVFRQGDVGDAFYIIYRGSVEIRLRKMLFFSTPVACLGPGHFIGEIALISNEPRTASVVCSSSPTLLFTLVAADFQFVLKENPAAAEEMKRIAARRKFVTTHAK